MCTRLYVRTYVCVFTNINVHNICTYVRMYAATDMHVHMFINRYKMMCAYMCICICINYDDVIAIQSNSLSTYPS